MQKWTWGFVAYLVAVILFGAWVRIAGAGAGCGNHWPTCQGVVVPVAPEAKTIIEFTHRVTSALSGLAGLGLLIYFWRTRSRALPWAIGMFFFLLLEGFIGAVLVKKELVANDASVNRAVVISLHLANTMLLMFCAVAAAVRAGAMQPKRSTARGLLLVAIAALIITNMTGAVTALGDTLFPSQPAFGPELVAKLRDDLSAGQHFLVRLRWIHPVIAAITGLIVFAAMSIIHRRTASRWALAGMLLVLCQIGLGVMNIALSAPGWMQITHLLVAQTIWICAVVLWID
ncbi:COX15/CtaA family protein [Bryobacter aggregatus]|uniref:COX15/CtaA family protein n=1 Tax=Bryobacter aggregatus TaxID=360054 RepID=UPI0004E11D6F|nr:COX15/CtaA family protein [Bryobacter aggregatus]